MSSRASAWLRSIYCLVMWGGLHSLCLTIHIFKKMVITLTQLLPEVVSGINRDHLYKVLNMAFGPWKVIISSQLAWFFHSQYLCAHSTMQSEATECPHFCLCEFKISKMPKFSSREVIHGNAAKSLIFVTLMEKKILYLAVMRNYFPEWRLKNQKSLEVEIRIVKKAVGMERYKRLY